jgi:hypothetical protein
VKCTDGSAKWAGHPGFGFRSYDAAYQKFEVERHLIAGREQMLAEADKFPMSTRRQIYHNGVERAYGASGKLAGRS